MEGEKLAVGEEYRLRTDRTYVDAHCHSRSPPPIEAGGLPGLFAPTPIMLRLLHEGSVYYRGSRLEPAGHSASNVVS
jgi:hypothetical protein